MTDDRDVWKRETTMPVEIRNYIHCPPKTRRAERRVVRNIVGREGVAKWLNEDVVVHFNGIGYAKFPEDDYYHLSVCVMEVLANGRRVGWVRVEPETVKYTDFEEETS